ncbi:carboxypeptidase-like regulatory domain-containing protein [Algoriphagus namhaensis]
MSRYFSFVVLLFSFAQQTLAQSGLIFGQVSQSITEDPLPGAHIFVPSTTYQTYSDSMGRYALPAMPQGHWEIVVHAIDHEPARTQLILNKKELNQNMQLGQKVKTESSGKKITKNLDRLTNQFFKDFTGLETSGQLWLVNPEALIFSKKDKEISVSSYGPLYFQNEETGFLITSYFEPFELGLLTGPPVADYVYFTQEAGNAAGQVEINSKRLALFKRSLEYQLLRLLSGETESFSPNPQPSVRYSDLPNEYYLSFQPTTLSFADGFKVKFSLAEEEILVKISGAPVHGDELQLDQELEPLSPLFYLPENFNGDQILRISNIQKDASVLYERPFVHTDRSYYWPNEAIFFKAYMNYAQPGFAGELSRVLHLELLDTAGTLISHQLARLDNGTSAGYLIHEEPLPKGNYILRAYTAWSANYGLEGIFDVPIQVLDWDEFPAPHFPETQSRGVSFFANQQSFGANEEVVLNIMTLDEQGRPVDANLSLAVLDLNQTQPGYFHTSPEEFGLGKVTEKLENFKNEVEFGATLEGQIFDPAKKPLKGNVELLMNGFENKLEMSTDSDEGSFVLKDIRFENELEIAMKALARGVPKPGKNLEIKRFATSIPLSDFTYSQPVLSGNSFLPLEEIRAGMEIGEILMDEAVIESTRERKEGAMPYGKADTVVDPSEFNLNGDVRQFLYLLAGKIPGMQVQGEPPSVRFRGGEPLVLVNGTPAALAGTPVLTVLSQINVFAIERVEVIRRLVPFFGDQGRNGIISIITKTGPDYDKAIQANMNLFQSFTFRGFQSSDQIKQKIQEATFNSKDQRPLLYWNPNLNMTRDSLSKKISFQTGNRPGPMWLEIRGITAQGELIHGDFLIQVKD